MEADGGRLESECFLAEKLGKTLDEIRAMPEYDLTTLAVYYGRKAQRQQLAAAQTRR